MKNKRGMYIVEASIILPLFICSMVMVISIIPLISTCENIVYSVADEMRLEAGKAGVGIRPVLLPAAAAGRVRSENSGISTFSVSSYRTGVTRNGIDDLMCLSFRARLGGGSSLIAVNGITFNGNLVSRAFTGSVHTVSGATDESVVYIFPQDGVRFHSRGCRYLEAHCHMTVLSQNLMERYHACPLCGAAAAHIGDTVFYFERAGEAYHKPGCRQVEREKYYTETTRSSAERAGYTPCSVCSG